MKLIGKQIVVELPKKLPRKKLCFKNGFSKDEMTIYNAALSEVANMNPAWEVDIGSIEIIINQVKAKNKNSIILTLEIANPSPPTRQRG